MAGTTMNFDHLKSDQEPPLPPMTFREYAEWCEPVIAMNQHLTPDTCMTLRTDEADMPERFTLFPERKGTKKV